MMKVGCRPECRWLVCPVVDDIMMCPKAHVIGAVCGILSLGGCPGMPIGKK